MVKISLLFGFVVFSFVGVSQTTVVKIDESKDLVKEVLNLAPELEKSVNGSVLVKPDQKIQTIRPVEKIQTTVGGIIIYQMPYKPEYPTPVTQQNVSNVANQ